MRQVGRELLAALMDFVWPLRCPLCDRELGPDDALRGGPLAPPSLHPRCLERLPTTAQAGARPSRRTMPARFLFVDGPEFFAVLHAAKFGGRPDAVVPLARRLAEAATQRGWVPAGAVIVPTPDDPRKPRDVSVVGLIAESVSRTTRARLRTDLLARRAGGLRVSRAGGAARRRAVVAGRFTVARLAEIPSETPLILIDDQLTTGATATEAGRILSRRGNPVSLITLGGSNAAPGELPLTL